MIMTRLSFVAAAICCSLAAADSVEAQGSVAGGKVKGARLVAIVHSAQSLGPSHVKVVRRVQAEPRDIVLVDSAASSQDLAAALLLFAMLRSQNGDSLTEPMSAVPSNALLPPTFSGGSLDAWSVAQLRRLRTSGALRSVPGFGTSKVIMVRVPPATVRVSGETR
jgi:hypothetical protein